MGIHIHAYAAALHASSHAAWSLAMHTYIDTYMHTYIHTHIHTYIYSGPPCVFTHSMVDEDVPKENEAPDLAINRVHFDDR